MAYLTPWLDGDATGIVQVKDSNNNWVSLIDPSGMSQEIYDIDAGGSTGRNLNGDLLRDRVAAGKEKLVMEFPPMQAQDFATMMALVANEFFQCKYWSLAQGKEREVTMYVGDRSASRYYKLKNETEKEIMWTDIKFNFIEK